MIKASIKMLAFNNNVRLLQQDLEKNLLKITLTNVR